MKGLKLTKKQQILPNHTSPKQTNPHSSSKDPIKTNLTKIITSINNSPNTNLNTKNSSPTSYRNPHTTTKETSTTSPTHGATKAANTHSTNLNPNSNDTQPNPLHKSSKQSFS